VKKTLPKMTLSRETLKRLDPSRLHLAGGLDTDHQCVPLTAASCNISCASACMHCGYTYEATYNA